MFKQTPYKLAKRLTNDSLNSLQQLTLNSKVHLLRNLRFSIKQQGIKVLFVYQPYPWNSLDGQNKFSSNMGIIM